MLVVHNFVFITGNASAIIGGVVGGFVAVIAVLAAAVAILIIGIKIGD